METFAIGAGLIIQIACILWLLSELRAARSLNGKLQREVEHSRKYADKIAAEFDKLMTRKPFPELFTPAEMERASQANVHARRWRDNLSAEPKPPIEWKE